MLITTRFFASNERAPSNRLDFHDPSFSLPTWHLPQQNNLHRVHSIIHFHSSNGTLLCMHLLLILRQIEIISVTLCVLFQVLVLRKENKEIDREKHTHTQKYSVESITLSSDCWVENFLSLFSLLGRQFFVYDSLKIWFEHCLKHFYGIAKILKHFRSYFSSLFNIYSKEVYALAFIYRPMLIST